MSFTHKKPVFSSDYRVNGLRSFNHNLCRFWSDLAQSIAITWPGAPTRAVQQSPSLPAKCTFEVLKRLDRVSRRLFYVEEFTGDRHKQPRSPPNLPGNVPRGHRAGSASATPIQLGVRAGPKFRCDAPALIRRQIILLLVNPHLVDGHHSLLVPIKMAARLTVPALPSSKVNRWVSRLNLRQNIWACSSGGYTARHSRLASIFVGMCKDHEQDFNGRGVI